MTNHPRSRRKQRARDAETRWLLGHPAPGGLLATVWRTQGKPLPDYHQGDRERYGRERAAS
jgi:hypothetical protein